VAQLYPRALSSLYVVSYDSQGYGGGILTLPLPRGQVPVYIAWRELSLIAFLHGSHMYFLQQCFYCGMKWNLKKLIFYTAVYGRLPSNGRCLLAGEQQ
jgi:hypothetical protein